MPQDRDNERALIDYENRGIEQMRRAESESLWGDNEGDKTPPQWETEPEGIKLNP